LEAQALSQRTLTSDEVVDIVSTLLKLHKLAGDQDCAYAIQRHFSTQPHTHLILSLDCYGFTSEAQQVRFYAGKCDMLDYNHVTFCSGVCSMPWKQYLNHKFL
jgi:hypothetical protein